jgi:hypothetical protein
MKNKKRVLWTEEERNSMLKCYQSMLADHQIPLIFTLISDDGSNRDVCFAGMLSVKEGVDTERARHLQAMDRLGCRVITFASKEQNPPIPNWLLQNQGVGKQDFIQRELPLTHLFGSFRWYRDFQDEDIEALINVVHERDQKVALLTFSEISPSLLHKADVIVSCAPIYHTERGLNSEEIFSVEIPGNACSSSCPQTVKESAKILVPRPSEDHGGLNSLISILMAARRAHNGFSSFLRYMMGMQLVRMLLVLIPMISGKPTLDARHIIFCGCVLDLFAFFVFSMNRSLEKNSVKMQKTCGDLRTYVTKNKTLLLASLIAAGLTLVLPYLLEAFDIFGTYLYQTEFSFTSMLLIHLVALVVIRYPSVKEMRQLLRNYWIIIEWVVVLLLLIMCYTDLSFGDLFGMEKNPLPYLILSLIPAISFGIVMMVYPSKKGKSGEKKSKR